jgi:hypothetical protein
MLLGLEADGLNYCLDWMGAVATIFCTSPYFFIETILYIDISWYSISSALKMETVSFFKTTTDKSTWCPNPVH